MNKILYRIGEFFDTYPVRAGILDIVIAIIMFTMGFRMSIVIGICTSIIALYFVGLETKHKMYIKGTNPTDYTIMKNTFYNEVLFKIGTFFDNYPIRAFMLNITIPIIALILGFRTTIVLGLGALILSLYLLGTETALAMILKPFKKIEYDTKEKQREDERIKAQ